MEAFEKLLKSSAAAHGHLCPGQAVGVRMAMLGCKLIGLDEPTSRDQIKKILVYVEMDRCTADAVAHVTGVKLGRRSLKFMDYGIMAATFVNLETKKAFRIVSTEESRDLSDFTSLFIPMMIENTINGMIGVSMEHGVLSDDAKDILHLVSNRVSHVLTNATLHRDTKLLALTDGLTGLLNHRAFYERLKQEFERYRRYGSNLPIIIADSDDLKKYNDTFGHPVGDEILRKIGEIFRETSRETDILARYGGDEFVILLPQTNAENTVNMARRMKERIENYEFAIQGKKFNTSISMGISTVPQDYIETPQALFESADRALYQAKRAGKKRIVVASESE